MDLSGNHIGLLGFPAELAGELGTALRGAGCRASNLPTARGDLSDLSKGCDILLVWAGQDGSTPRAEELAATSQRWLLFGLEEPIRHNPLYLRADDVILNSPSLDELLFRIYRTIHRMNHEGQSAPARLKPAVLVADDDPDILTLLKSVLRQNDWDCHFVKDGRQAFAMAQRLLPDLLVLDIEMPFMTGLEVLRRIRRDAETQGLKVLLLTASTDLKRVESGLSLGADDYFAKPFSPTALVHRVRNLLSVQMQRFPNDIIRSQEWRFP
jgi:CheY-like chemotaxis protein